MNDVIDELAWSDARLARVAGTPNSFIESGALEDYRNYICGIREEILQDLLGIYEEHYDNQAVLSPFEGRVSERIIQSRHYGRLIATLSSPSNSGGESMDFVDPYTQRVYASFVRKVETNGDTDWVLRAVNDAQVAQAKPLSYISSLLLVRRGTAAIEALPALEQSSRIAPRAVRAGLELLAEEMLMKVQRTSEPLSQEAQHDPLQRLLEKELTDKANELIRAGREAYQRMVLSREPTTVGIADLLAEGVIEIKAVSGTTLKSGVGVSPVFRSFYIQKVTASSVPPEVLWFAHFHYPAGHTGGAMGFYFAHLKPAGRAVTGFQQQLRAAQGQPERLLGLYRTIIERDVAQTLFFSREVSLAQ